MNFSFLAAAICEKDEICGFKQSIQVRYMVQNHCMNIIYQCSLTNCFKFTVSVSLNLQVKATCVFLIIIFQTSLQQYLRLTTTSMEKDTLIKYKKVSVICEKSGPIITNYNTLLIQLKAKPFV